MLRKVVMNVDRLGPWPICRRNWLLSCHMLTCIDFEDVCSNISHMANVMPTLRNFLKPISPWSHLWQRT